MAVRKKKAKSNGRRPRRTARLNLMIEPELKDEMHDYAVRNSKSLSSLITEHFLRLLDREKEPDVEQI